MSSFQVDVEAIRERARKNMSMGAVTPGYQADRDAILKILNDALATEWVCVLRYRNHYYMAKGINSEPVAAEFLEHANEEQEHADKLANRISQLGGNPDMNPVHLCQDSHARYVEGTSLVEMIRENLLAERVVVDIYSEMIRFVGDKDPTTRRILEAILADEEEHADDMADLLTSFAADQGSSSQGEANGQTQGASQQTVSGPKTAPKQRSAS